MNVTGKRTACLSWASFLSQGGQSTHRRLNPFAAVKGSNGLLGGCNQVLLIQPDTGQRRRAQVMWA